MITIFLRPSCITNEIQISWVLFDVFFIFDCILWAKWSRRKRKSKRNPYDYCFISPWVCSSYLMSLQRGTFIFYFSLRFSIYFSKCMRILLSFFIFTCRDAPRRTVRTTESIYSFGFQLRTYLFSLYNQLLLLLFVFVCFVCNVTLSM